MEPENVAKLVQCNYSQVLKLNLGVIKLVVFCCCRIKARIIEVDEREEKGIRTILNFGHTVGHAIEAASGYKFYTHGEAIALGMLCSSRLAQRMGILDLNSVLRIEKVISGVGLPLEIKRVRLSKILSALEHDKKFIAGEKRFVLPEAIGKAGVFEGISLKLIKSAIKERFRA